MRHYHHLTTEERENLLVQVTQGKGIREIARELNRNASTISREIKRNSNLKRYSALAAQKQYEKRRQASRRKKRLEEDQTKEKVEKLLNAFWSPEQISERLKKEHAKVQIGTSTIYRGDCIAERVNGNNLHKKRNGGFRDDTVKRKSLRADETACGRVQYNPRRGNITKESICRNDRRNAGSRNGRASGLQ